MPFLGILKNILFRTAIYVIIEILVLQKLRAVTKI